MSNYLHYLCRTGQLPVAASHLDNGDDAAGSDQGQQDQHGLGSVGQLAQHGASTKQLSTSSGNEACGQEKEGFYKKPCAGVCASVDWLSGRAFMQQIIHRCEGDPWK